MSTNPQNNPLMYDPSKLFFHIQDGNTTLTCNDDKPYYLQEIINDIIENVLAKSSELHKIQFSESSSPFFRCITPISGLRSPIPRNITPITINDEDITKWQNLYDYLKDISEINKKEPIPINYKHEATQKIELFKNESKDLQDDLFLLWIISQTISLDSFINFISVLNKIKTQYPELNEYLISWDPIVTKKGIVNLLKFFEEEYGFEKDILSCQNANTIPDIVQNILESEENLILRGWIAYDPNPNIAHVSPVFLRKEKSKVKVFVINSLGHEVSKTYQDIPIVVIKLIEKFANQREIFDKLEIYSYKISRQNDGSSCPIFSILDLKNIYESSLDNFDIFKDCLEKQPRNLIIQYFVDKDVDQTNCLKLYEVEILPASMMKVTQSIKTTEIYRQSSPLTLLEKIPKFLRLSPNGEKINVLQTMESFTQSVEDYIRHSRPGYIKSIASSKKNKYIERKKMELITIMISRVLNDFLPK